MSLITKTLVRVIIQMRLDGTTLKSWLLHLSWGKTLLGDKSNIERIRQQQHTSELTYVTCLSYIPFSMSREMDTITMITSSKKERKSSNISPSINGQFSCPSRTVTDHKHNFMNLSSHSSESLHKLLVNIFCKTSLAQFTRVVNQTGISEGKGKCFLWTITPLPSSFQDRNWRGKRTKCCATGEA